MQTNKTGIISHVQRGNTNLFTFRKCGITINHKRLRKSQAKGCVPMGTPKITAPPHSTIKQ